MIELSKLLKLSDSTTDSTTAYTISMKLIKGFALLVLLVVLGLGGTYLAYNRGLLDDTFLAELPLQQIQSSLPHNSESFFSSANEQTQQLGERAQVVGGQAQQVLGSYVEVNNDAEEKSLTDRAFEVTRYYYCKQVVTDWEKNSSQLE